MSDQIPSPTACAENAIEMARSLLVENREAHIAQLEKIIREQAMQLEMQQSFEQ